MPTSISKGFYARYSRKLLIFLLCVSPFALYASAVVLTPGDMSGYLLDVSHWLPQQKELVRDMKRFSEVAGRERGNVIRVSWDGCFQDDPKRLAYANALKELRWPNELSEEKQVPSCSMTF